MHSPVTSAPTSAKHSKTNACQLELGIGSEGGDGGGEGGIGGGNGGVKYTSCFAFTSSIIALISASSDTTSAVALRTNAFLSLMFVNFSLSLTPASDPSASAYSVLTSLRITKFPLREESSENTSKFFSHAPLFVHSAISAVHIVISNSFGAYETGGGKGPELERAGELAEGEGEGIAAEGIASLCGPT